MKEIEFLLNILKTKKLLTPKPFPTYYCLIKSGHNRTVLLLAIIETYKHIYIIKRNSGCLCVCLSALTPPKLLEVQASNLARLITTPWWVSQECWWRHDDVIIFFYLVFLTEDNCFLLKRKLTTLQKLSFVWGLKWRHNQRFIAQSVFCSSSNSTYRTNAIKRFFRRY